MPLSMVIFKNEPRPVYAPSADGVTRVAILSWSKMVSLGTDDVPYSTDVSIPAPGLNATALEVTMRELHLRVEFESMDQRPQYSAWDVAERFRGKLYSPSSLAMLDAANIAIIVDDDGVSADYVVDGRYVSRVAMPISFNQTDTTPDIGGPITTIEHVVVSSESIEDQSGTPLPASMQFTNEEMP